MDNENLEACVRRSAELLDIALDPVQLAAAVAHYSRLSEAAELCKRAGPLASVARPPRQVD